jgi:Ca2+-binding EF-hand superfamily protein
MSGQMDKILLHFQDFDFSAYKRIDLVKLLKVLTGDSVTEEEIEQVLVAASVPQDGPVNFTKVSTFYFR